MISAFAHQLSELEKKIREQGSQIYQIYSKLQDDTNDTNSQADSDCKQLLDCLQSQIKHNSFKLNELHSKVVQHDVDIGGLKAAVTCDGHHQKLAANTAYNPLAIEFQPRLAVMPDTQTDFASGGVITSLAKEHRRPASAPYFTGSYDANPDHGQSQDSPGTFGIFPPPDMFPPLSDHDQVSFSRDVDAASPRDLSQGDRDTELMLLKEELSYCKGRVHELEMELENKNHIIRDLMGGHEQLMRKETEHAQKQEWFEHKMRLLKQDKRRRGETIGKLLKCIDDMKDTGRVDESKVTEGKAVLVATLGSRGLPAEDRIRAAVDAAEAERCNYLYLFTVARHRAKMEAANAVDAVPSHGIHIDDNNHNNSAQDRQCCGAPLEDSSSQHSDCGDVTSPVTSDLRDAVRMLGESDSSCVTAMLQPPC
ncbi:hypothetical protein NP493_1069g00070 [Ridgeia piscesae]|uniref:Uncharacterized protein n=1 Tax=Ridgeia piscesae TaxID=27915 RepID=A0AAD9KHT2_RIDPI|nr:hypothetical protein NP493_1069g00070 [Ridgeia piscesae]